MDLLHFFLETGFWVAMVRMATPLIFGTLGELVCERAGVLNLGIEGIMAAGWMWVYLGGTLWGGIAFAACIGIGFGLPYLFSIVALIVMSRKPAYPKALLNPSGKGSGKMTDLVQNQPNRMDATAPWWSTAGAAVQCQGLPW